MGGVQGVQEEEPPEGHPTRIPARRRPRPIHSPAESKRFALLLRPQTHSLPNASMRLLLRQLNAPPSAPQRRSISPLRLHTTTPGPLLERIRPRVLTESHEAHISRRRRRRSSRGRAIDSSSSPACEARRRIGRLVDLGQALGFSPQLGAGYGLGLCSSSSSAEISISVSWL